MSEGTSSMIHVNGEIADELDRQAGLLVDKAESLGDVPPNTSSSGAVIALQDTAEELRARAADLREGMDPAGDESDQWCVFYGGPDPHNAAGVEVRDDEADAREHVQWIDAGHGRGVARRAVHYGPWEIVI